MNGSLLLWMTLSMLFFWGVGLYNRLMRMHSRAFGALGSFEKHLCEYVDLSRELMATAHDEAVDQTPAQRQESARCFALLLAEVKGLDLALKEARKKPLTIESMAGLQQAIITLQQAWEGLLTLPVDFAHAGTAVPKDMQVRWNATTHRVETSRNGYNQILLKYNAALAQFPARLIVGLMGVKPGGLL
jgi:LemA protein